MCVLYTILKYFYLRDTDLAWHPLCNSSKRLRLCAMIGKLGRQRRRCDNQVLRNADTVMQPPSLHFPQLNLELTALCSISTGCQPPRVAESVSVAFWECVLAHDNTSPLSHTHWLDMKMRKGREKCKCSLILTVNHRHHLQASPPWMIWSLQLHEIGWDWDPSNTKNKNSWV